MRYGTLALVLVALYAPIAGAGEADIVDVKVQAQGGGRYAFEVTVRHADEGWNHYADKWDLVAPDGTVLGTRVLLHPHEDEQPFTRSLSGVSVPPASTGSPCEPMTSCTAMAVRKCWCRYPDAAPFRSGRNGMKKPPTAETVGGFPCSGERCPIRDQTE